MDKKYILTDETKIWFGRKLHRIQAVRNFSNVKAGDLGGWIEKEENLSHDGSCWVDDEAMVYGNAQVYDNAQIYNNAHVYDNACVFNSAQIYGDSQIYGNACVYDNVWIFGSAWVYDNAQIYGSAWVYDNAQIYGSACVFNSAYIGNNARIYGYAQICDNAQVTSLDDVIFIPNIGSCKDTTTFFKCVDNTIKVRCGYFHSTVDEFEKTVKETHGDNKFAKEYKLAIELAKLHILGE